MAVQRYLSTWWLLVTIAVVSALGDSCDSPGNAPTVWLGGEQQYNDCQDPLPSCSYFGLTFICENRTGGEFPACTNGTKFLCASPPSVPLDDPTPATTFRVLAYNVLELPYQVYQDGQQERTCRIPHEIFRLHPDVDVVVFNEVFIGGCFSHLGFPNASVLSLRDLMRQHGFVHMTQTAGEPPVPPKLINSGVFIASRWPITREDSLVYAAADLATSDALAAKGAVYAKIEKTSGGRTMTYHVLGTHMQSEETQSAERVRAAQAAEMHSLMLRQNISSAEPVIYAGDMNAVNGTADQQAVVDALDASVPDIIGQYQFTYDGPENDILALTEYANWTGWIDYVITSNSHLQPIEVTLEAVRPVAATPFPICALANASVPIYADSSRCQTNITTQDYSDHYAVLGVFHFEEATESTTPTSKANGLTSSFCPYLLLTFITFFLNILPN